MEREGEGNGRERKGKSSGTDRRTERSVRGAGPEGG
jgi:hypothetical protein